MLPGVVCAELLASGRAVSSNEEKDRQYNGLALPRGCGGMLPNDSLKSIMLAYPTVASKNTENSRPYPPFICLLFSTQV